MQTKVSVKKPELAPGRKNNHINKPTANKKNVRTTDHKKLLQIMLNNPYAITREEFIVLQSAIGYRRTVEIREEAILRKKQGKLEQTNVAMNPISLEKSKSEISKKDASEFKNNAEKNPLQMKKDDGNTSTSSLDMQHNLRDGLEKLSGVDLSDVKVHQNSSKPQQVGALAYTQGNDIHIAPGQEKHLPHEGWHAVQQKQGRVSPTMQMKTGTLVNDDAGLEKEADVMGSKAVKEGLKTDTLQLKKSSHIRQVSMVIQRTKNLPCGGHHFFNGSYEPTKTPGKKVGRCICGKILTTIYMPDTKGNSNLVTATKLKDFGWKNTSKTFVEKLNNALINYGIKDKKSIRLFMATMAAESNYGKTAEEGGTEEWFKKHGYTSKTKGAGYIQVTGDAHKEFLKTVPKSPPDNNTAKFIANTYPMEASAWYWSKMQKTGEGNLNAYVKKNGDSLGIFLITQFFVHGFPTKDKNFDHDLALIREGKPFKINGNHSVTINGRKWNFDNDFRWADRKKAYKDSEVFK